MNHYQKAQKLLGPWTPRLALEARVEREAQVMWALKEDMPFEVIPPLPEVKWEGPVLYAFGRGVYREVRRILP